MISKVRIDFQIATHVHGTSHEILSPDSAFPLAAAPRGRGRPHAFPTLLVCFMPLKKAASKTAKRICACGCSQKPVTAQTERNHLKGKARPLVKAHHAARRLAALGLSPGHAKDRISLSSVLSPPGKRRERRAARTPNALAMEIDVDAQPQSEAPDEDALPQFFPEDAGGMDAEPTAAMLRDIPSSPAQNVAPTDLYDPDAATTLQDATVAAHDGVWSEGHRVTVEEEPEEDGDAAMYMDADLQDEDDFWGDEEEYDEYEWLYGLPAGDIVDEEMERELAEFGMFPSLAVDL